jgi:hypothetical protein
MVSVQINNINQGCFEMCNEVEVSASREGPQEGCVEAVPTPLGSGKRKRKYRARRGCAA